MPRFHLHIRTPTGLIEDEEGTDLSDHATAIAEAVRGARGLMKGEVTDGTLCLDQSIEIYRAPRPGCSLSQTGKERHRA